MRKVRDYDAELKALAEKAKKLKARKVEQLGALVVATGADALDLEVIAGMLRQGVIEAEQVSVKESWRADGATFLEGRRRKGRPKAGSNQQGDGQKPRGETAG